MPRRIEVRITGDAKDLLASLEIAKIALRSFGDAANKDLGKLRIATDSGSVSLRRFDDNTDRTTKSLSKLRTSADNSARSTRSFGNETERAGKKAETAKQHHQDLGTSFRKIRDELLLLAVPTVAGIIPVLINGLSGLASGAVSLVSGLVPSVGALVALRAATAPAALGVTSLVQGLVGAGFALSVFKL